MLTVWQYARLTGGVGGATFQTAYPISDVSAGSWTPSTGTDLYAMLADSSDGTYIRSSTGASSDVAEVALGPLSTPGPGTVTIKIRHRAV